MKNILIKEFNCFGGFIESLAIIMQNSYQVTAHYLWRMKVCIKSFQGFVLCNTVPLMSVSNIVCRRMVQSPDKRWHH